MKRKVNRQRLKLARVSKGWSQKDLADRLKTSSFEQISRYETGKFQPSDKMVKRLAQILEVSYDYLMDSDPSNIDPSLPEANPPENIEWETIKSNFELVSSLNLSQTDRSSLNHILKLFMVKNKLHDLAKD